MCLDCPNIAVNTNLNLVLIILLLTAFPRKSNSVLTLYPSMCRHSFTAILVEWPVRLSLSPDAIYKHKIPGTDAFLVSKIYFLNLAFFFILFNCWFSYIHHIYHITHPPQYSQWFAQTLSKSSLPSSCLLWVFSLKSVAPVHSSWTSFWPFLVTFLVSSMRFISFWQDRCTIYRHLELNKTLKPSYDYSWM